VAGPDALLPEFDQEMAVTRLVLERLPEAAFGWRPHPKSYDLGSLASHLAQIPRWGMSILTRDVHDMESAGPRAAPLATVAEILERFDGHVREVRKRLVEMSDAELASIWTLRRGPHIVLTMPKIAAVRAFVLHHTIHHRGQLTVYLRQHDVPIPPLYGPTADEQM
jgi:uncharacterized damage-inducible protein DinB